MTTTHRPTRVALMAVLMTAAVAAPAASASPSLAASFSAAPVTSLSAAPVASMRFALPEPGGRHAVGRDVLHLVDRARRDPWKPVNPRELLASIYYPAVGRPGPTAPYLTEAEARLLLEQRELIGVVDPADLAATRTNARPSARPLPGRYPLVILSPGFPLHRHTLSHFAEELASRGYVVASIEHAYESAGAAFPGGRVFPCLACDAVSGKGREAYAAVATGRAGDVSFVLDRLTGRKPAWRHARLIDRTRIGMAGHSIGGAATATTMATDPRVRAGINMDGTFFAPVPATGLSGRPFMMFGTPSHSPGGGTDETWERDWQTLNGWKRWLTLTGANHLDFSDIAALTDQSGLPDETSPLPGPRTVHLMRAYVTDFFNQHLRGIPSPLLNAPTPSNPEVEFHNPS